MRPLLSLVLILGLTVPSHGADALLVRRSQEKPGRIDLVARNASFRAVAAALEMHLGHPVVIDARGDFEVDLVLRAVSPDQALRAATRKAGLELLSERGVSRVRDPLEPSVTMDVVDAELSVLLRLLTEQCGIRNVMIRPGVSGKGTFRFEAVPCGTAFDVIFNSLGIEGSLEPNSVLVVERQR